MPKDHLLSARELVPSGRPSSTSPPTGGGFFGGVGWVGRLVVVGWSIVVVFNHKISKYAAHAQQTERQTLQIESKQQLKTAEMTVVKDSEQTSHRHTLPPSCARTAEALALASCTRSASALNARRGVVYSTPSSPVGLSSPCVLCLLAGGVRRCVDNVSATAGMYG